MYQQGAPPNVGQGFQPQPPRNAPAVPVLPQNAPAVPLVPQIGPHPPQLQNGHPTSDDDADYRHKY